MMSNTTAIEFMARIGPRPLRWCHGFSLSPSEDQILDHFRTTARLNQLTLLKLRWTPDEEAAVVVMGLKDEWVGSVRLLD